MIYVCGNGGMASFANHFAAELMGKFGYDVFIPCISLCSNEALITAIANDMGFENVYSHQLEILGKKEDTLIALTTSELSPDDCHSLNIYRAVDVAKRKGMKVILMDKNNLEGCNTAEKQNDAIKLLHNLALELKKELL